MSMVIGAFEKNSCFYMYQDKKKLAKNASFNPSGADAPNPVQAVPA